VKQPLQQLPLAPLPIDRVARRVTSAAAPEHVWRPLPKPAAAAARSRHVLPTAPIPAVSLAGIAHVLGQRRGRMTVVGYAAEQPAGKGNARWVVRCDCGNYEHRTRILRWLGTHADDRCAECQNRAYLRAGGEWRPRDPAERA
jgi:hypothetical protein